MREIVIDTETTGLDPLSDHRIVEIGAVELVDHGPSIRPCRRRWRNDRGNGNRVRALVKRIATDIDTSIPDFLKRQKGDKPKPETRDQKGRQS